MRPKRTEVLAHLVVQCVDFILTEFKEVTGMQGLSIHLLGKFCVRHDDQVVDGFGASKVQKLFCYLLLHRGRPHPRETLSSLLWSDSTTAQSVLSELKHRLGTE